MTFFLADTDRGVGDGVLGNSSLMIFEAERRVTMGDAPLLAAAFLAEPTPILSDKTRPIYLPVDINKTPCATRVGTEG